MNNIIIQQKTINQQVQNTVNARDLWVQLESKREFANWIKDRLVDFIDGIDFLTISSKTSGRPAIDYYLTIETAKHIAMIERNEKGKEIRQYFIDFENKHKAPPIENLSRKQLALMIIEAEEEKEKLQLANQKQEAVIQEYFAIDDNKTYTDIAKILHLPPLKFITALKKMQYIRENRIPYQKYIDSGYFTIKKTVKEYGGLTKHFESYLITPKGFQYFSKKFNKISLS